MARTPNARLVPWASMLRSTAEGRNFAWLSGERVLQLVAGLIVGAVVARHLGVSDYGQLAFALAFVAVLTPFTSAGNGLAVRDIETAEVPAHQVLANTAALVATMTLGGTGLLLLGSWAFPGFLPSGSAVLVVLVLAGPVFKPFAVVDYWFQATLDARRAAIARNTSFFTGVAARVVAVLLDAPVTAFGAIIGLESVLSTVLLVLAYRRAGGDLSQWSLHRPHLRGLWRQALPQVLAGISVALYMRIDQIMLGTLSGVTQSGYYAIAVLLAEVTWFVPVALATTLTPSMTRIWERDQEAYYLRLQGLFTLTAAMAYAVVAASLAIGSWLLPLAYGDAFRPAVPVFVCLTFATPFVYLGVIQTLWTINARQQALALVCTLLAAVVNIVANILVLPRYGALGAAFTTVGSYAVAAVLANGLFVRTRRIGRMQLDALRLSGLRPLMRDPLVALRAEGRLD